MIELVSGSKALANAAITAGVSWVSSYPGSPATYRVDDIAALTSPEELLYRIRKEGILENYLRLNPGFLKVTFLTSDGEGWQSSVT